MVVFIFGESLVSHIENLHDKQIAHPELNSDVMYYEMTREEKMAEWWRRYRVAMSDPDMKKWFAHDSKLNDEDFGWSYVFPGQSPITLHQTMFTRAMQMFATDEQQAHYMPQIGNLNIIGCYAQTELGHGSNVAGLETTATYDEASETFLIHSPSIKAAKFWPGALGCQSNYACIFARCIALGNDYGVQPFIVQIRDRETHEPLPGIEVGDIGTKLGYNSIDNGYLYFN